MNGNEFHFVYFSLMVHRLQALNKNKKGGRYTLYRLDTSLLQLQMATFAHLIAAVVVESFIETLRGREREKVREKNRKNFTNT